MAIDNNLVILVGVAGALLIIFSMTDKNKGTPSEEAAEELADDLQRGKNHLNDITQRYNLLLGHAEDEFDVPDYMRPSTGVIADWKIEKYTQLRKELFELEHEMDRIWQLRLGNDLLYEHWDAEQQQFSNRTRQLGTSIDEILAEHRGQTDPVAQHNYVQNTVTYANRESDQYTQNTFNVAEDHRRVEVRMAPGDFNSQGAEGARRQDLQDGLRISDSAGTTNSIQQGGFMAITDVPGPAAVSNANDASAMVVDDSGKNLPAAPTLVVGKIPPQEDLEKRFPGTFNNPRQTNKDKPVKADERKPVPKPPPSRANEIARAGAAVGSAPNFNAAPGQDGGNSQLLEARLDSLNKQLQTQQRNGDESGALETQTQIQDILRLIGPVEKPDLLQWSKKIYQLQGLIAGYKGEAHSVSRQTKLETLFESLMEQAPERLDPRMVDANLRKQWGTVYALAKSDRDTTYRKWGIKVRTATEAKLGDVVREGPQKKKKKIKPTAKPAKPRVDLTKGPNFNAATPLGPPPDEALYTPQPPSATPLPMTPTSAIQEEEVTTRKRSSTLTERPPSVAKVDDAAKKGAGSRNRLLYV